MELVTKNHPPTSSAWKREAQEQKTDQPTSNTTNRTEKGHKQAPSFLKRSKYSISAAVNFPLMGCCAISRFLLWVEIGRWQFTVQQL